MSWGRPWGGRPLPQTQWEGHEGGAFRDEESGRSLTDPPSQAHTRRSLNPFVSDAEMASGGGLYGNRQSSRAESRSMSPVANGDAEEAGNMAGSNRHSLNPFLSPEDAAGYPERRMPSSMLPSRPSSRNSSYASSMISSRSHSEAYELLDNVRTGATGNEFGPYAYEHNHKQSDEDSRSLSPMTDVIHTQNAQEKFALAGPAGDELQLLCDPNIKEDDDDLHNPDPRDASMLPGRGRPWGKRGVVNMGFLALVTIGVALLFIGYPIITFVKKKVEGTPSCQSFGCIFTNVKYSNLRLVTTSLIDSDTPKSAYTKTSRDGSTLNLVFSDEFEQEGRTFYENDDLHFQAVDLWYGVTQDLEWYTPDAVTTRGGVLELQIDAFKNHELDYRSGMVQSWNLFCFKNGMIEVSVSLPGMGNVSGLWPAVWTMGNLGRPGYAATTNGMWPFSYQECDVGITANQSRDDGLSWLPGMRLPACLCSADDSPGGTTDRARSAPEIDIMEVTSATVNGVMTGTSSMSDQLAPFDDFYQPSYDYVAVFNKSITEMNSYRGGPYQQAFSGLGILNNEWYDGNAYQTYGFEYQGGSSTDSFVRWHIGDSAQWEFFAPSLAANGNIGKRTISEEPMSIIFNLGLSNSFTTIDWPNLKFPATMRIDYVRIYQKDGEEITTCDPDGWETTDYIKNHPKAYKNYNMTTWADAGYSWPNNSYVHGCS